jgi:hypothetical protein
MPNLTMRVFDPKQRKEGIRTWPPAWIETETVRVGRFTAEMAYGARGFTCQWSPDVPGRGQLSVADLEYYKLVRNELMQRVANRLGGRVAVFE